MTKCTDDLAAARGIINGLLITLAAAFVIWLCWELRGVASL